jgi:M6 family metalloprotease-like protein
VAVLFVDFPDAVAAGPADEVLALLDAAAEFFAAVSYGRLEVELVPHLEWLRMANPSPHYAEAIRSAHGHRTWIEEAVTAADPVVDFAGIDEIVVIANLSAEAIGIGPTWVGGDFEGGTINVDGETITNGITSGADLPSWGFRWLTHEMGHSLSFVDL